ncbi:sensor histidine kinase [Pseudoalteromonas phenolica]|uniref:histidine kinase n=1 Tax=Pseudoalteromonas phenolica TaxID=161398 RepID=A0A5R9Q5E1_9GAMM|nr:ATP-binding protein [Pseudoalteromonas phenolica]TLX48175.1 sensor histidine kinase [Pseudoalteromonas phenolica]
MKRFTLLLAAWAFSLSATPLTSEVISEAKKLTKEGKLDVALKTLEREKQLIFQPQVNLQRAKIAREQAQYNQAIELLLPLLTLPEQSLEFRYEVNKELGVNFRRNMNTDKAEYYYLAAKQVALSLNNNDLKAQSMINLGVLYEAQGAFDKAMEQQTKAQKALESSENNELKAANYYNLFGLSNMLRQGTQARFFLEQALVYDKKTGHKRNIASTALTLAQLSAKEDDYQNAIPQLNEAISLLEQLNANEGLSSAHGTLFSIYAKQNKFSESLWHAKKENAYAEKTESTVRKFWSYIHLAQAYVQLKQPDLAINYLEMAKPLTEQFKSAFFAHQYNLYTSETYAQKENFEQAYKYLLKASKNYKAVSENKEERDTATIKKRLDNLLKSLKLAQEEKKHALTTIELENETLQKRIWLLASLLISVVSGFIIYAYYIKQKNTHYKAQMYQHNLEQKEQMLADISHELRTPLSVLKLHIEALEHNLIDDKFLAYGKINDKIAQLNNLISDVYQLSQLQNKALYIDLQEVNLHQLTQKFMSDIKVLTEQNQLRFISDIDFAANTVLKTDQSKLVQVILNLAKNACLYTDAPGHVRLKVRANHTQVFIQLDDSSPGVSDEDLPRLFDRLYRIDKSRSRALGGSGLGLSICQSLVQALGGKIVLKHGKSGGLCVQITLPIKRNT